MTAGGESGRDYRYLPFGDLLADIAGSEPVPAAGSAIAATAAMAAGLVAKTAARSAGRFSQADDIAREAESLVAELAPRVTEDAVLYAGALAVPRAERATEFAKTAIVPEAVAVAGERVAELALTLIHEGNPNLRYDAAAAAGLASSAASIAVSLLDANSAAGSDSARQSANRAEQFSQACRAAVKSPPQS